MIGQHWNLLINAIFIYVHTTHIINIIRKTQNQYKWSHVDFYLVAKPWIKVLIAWNYNKSFALSLYQVYTSISMYIYKSETCYSFNRKRKITTNGCGTKNITKIIVKSFIDGKKHTHQAMVYKCRLDNRTYSNIKWFVILRK